MKNLAITNANVFDSAGQAWVENAVLLAEEGKIAAIGPAGSVTIPENAQVIDASGAYVIPGMFDCHNHITLELSTEAGDEVDQLREPEVVNFERGLRLGAAQLRDGVTTFRDQGAKGHSSFRLREMFASGEALGPRLLCSGTWITSPHGHCAYPEMSIVCGVEEMRRAVRENLAKGADHIKLMVSGGKTSPKTFPRISYFSKEEIAVAVEEAHRVGKMVTAHCFGGTPLQYCVETGVDVIEHGGYFDDDDIEAVLKANAIVVSTLGFASRGIAMGMPGWRPEIIGRLMAGIEHNKKSHRRAHEAGVRMTVGGDGCHVDHAIADEIIMLVECGFTPAEALLAGTKVGAEACGIADETGTLEVGKYADAVLLESDPLQDITALRQVRSVIKQGQLVSAN